MSITTVPPLGGSMGLFEGLDGSYLFASNLGTCKYQSLVAQGISFAYCRVLSVLTIRYERVQSARYSILYSVYFTMRL